MSPKVHYSPRRGLTPLQNSIKVLQYGAYGWVEDKITPGSPCVGGRKGQAPRQIEKRNNVEVDFYRHVTANEDALLINLLLKKKNEQRISEGV